MPTRKSARKFSSSRGHRSTTVSLLLTALLLAILMGSQGSSFTALEMPDLTVAATTQSLENSVIDEVPCWEWRYIDGEWILVMVPCNVALEADPTVSVNYGSHPQGAFGTNLSESPPSASAPKVRA